MAPIDDFRSPSVRFSVVIVLALVVRRASEDGEEADEQDAQRRHRRADDADVDLDRRPYRNVNLVVGGIV